VRTIEDETFENKDLNWCKDTRLERCVFETVQSTFKVVLGTANELIGSTIDVEEITAEGHGNVIKGNKVRVWKVIREGLE
jgi:hypothetical protein